MPPAPFADYPAVTEYLYALKSGGVKFGIDRMTALSRALDHPERLYPVIHVAGTNGKGSVSAMIERILRAAGCRTGLYTSPHLVKLGERVQVDRRPLTDAEILAYVNELRPVAERIGAGSADDHPSFFEFMTAMAFLQFARERVDAAVIEVGMGGRLDATNVVIPEVTVITSIGLDHMEQLGHTFGLIAAEKAGIVKPGVPLVLGRVPEEAESVIRRIAQERDAPVHSVRETFGEAIAGYPETNLSGDCQRWNAATATLAARLLRGRFPGASDAVVAAALADVVWPGRWQRLPVGDREVILDASHNPEGAAMLDENLKRLFAATGRKPVVIVGVLGEFRARAVLEVVCRHAREVHLVRPQQARACSYEELEALMPPAARPPVSRGAIETIFPQPGRCALGQAGDSVIVTGSIYLLGEVLARIQPERGAGEGRLQDF